MRVISGQAKGRRLKKVPGDTTRPITDRVKENLFNILGDWVVGTRWLDLFAGTGQVGIEALSRGAAGAVFLDTARLAIITIHDNLRTTRLSGGALVLQQDAFSYLGQKPNEPYDVVYIAPPQYHELWSRVVMLVDRQPGRFLTAEGLVIVQIDPKEYSDLPLENLTLFDQRRYGRTMLCFYELKAYSSAS